MSNIFLKNELNGIFDTITESNVSLPKFVAIIDRAAKTTNPNTVSETSSYVGQLGGALSLSTTSANSTHDVNKLMAMLTSESSVSNSNAMSGTSTSALENQLRDILKQDGGSKKHKNGKKMQKGGSSVDVNDVKMFFSNLRQSGVDVDVKLNDKTMSEFFNESNVMTGGNLTGLLDSTTTEIPSKLSETSDANMEDLNSNILSVTSDNSFGKFQYGGAKSRNKSVKPVKSSKKSSMDGGVNPGFQAFLDLKKHIAEKLKISNGPSAAKVAGAVQKDMKEKFPNKDAVSIAEEGRKHFDKNVDHYKQMLAK